MSSAVHFDPKEARQPAAGETYADYLDSFGLFNGTGFVYREIVRNSPRHQLPVTRWEWARMVPTLMLAIELRDRMICAGASGLVVRAAHRPEGGEPDSQHKHNSALDLDLLTSDIESQPSLPFEFAAIASVLWHEHKHLRCGLGTYAPDGKTWTRRVHLDTFSKYGRRCWQGIGVNDQGKALFAKRPAALGLAQFAEDDPAVRACIADGRPRIEGP